MARAIDTCTCTHSRREHFLVDPDQPFQFRCADPDCDCPRFIPHPQPLSSPIQPKEPPCRDEQPAKEATTGSPTSSAGRRTA